MADITDPQVTAFSNTMRVDSEDFNQLQAYLRDTQTRFNTVISGLPAWTAAVGADEIEDGRSAEGVTRLTKNDLLNLMTQINLFLTAMDLAGVLDVIRKPNVRPLRDRRGV